MKCCGKMCLENEYEEEEEEKMNETWKHGTSVDRKPVGSQYAACYSNITSLGIAVTCRTNEITFVQSGKFRLTLFMKSSSHGNFSAN